jgi:3-isopropylmalate dehydrogenase
MLMPKVTAGYKYQDIANPVSLILSAAMLLDWMSGKHGNPKLAAAAKDMFQAVDLVLANPATRTRDLGGALGTQAFADVVAGAIRK